MLLLERLLKSLKGRKAGPHNRIGTRSGYLKRLASVLGAGALAQHAGVSEADLRKELKKGEGILSFFDSENANPAAYWKTGAKGVEVSGTPLAKDDGAYTLTSGSIMDFDCVITSGRRDRDGDVLEPKGAVIDPKMPLLWQHIPFQPIGRMVRLLEQTDEKVTGRFMIADTQLGRDAAVLIESGCLRISHGFAPIEYNPLKDEQGKDMGGWKITKYSMMEASAVSIPSNIDAEIEAFSRGKFHHPMVKAFYGQLSANRPKYLKAFEGDAVKLFDGQLTLNIIVKGAGTKADDDEEEKADDDDEREDKDERVEDEDAKAEDDDETEEKAEDEDETEEKADDDGDDDDEGDGSKQARALGEIIDSVREMVGDKSLPKEATGRLNIVAGMYEDIEEGIGGASDALAEAAKARDLAGMCSAMAELVEGCCVKLGRASEELERVAGIEDLPDGVASKIGEVVEDSRNIMAAVAEMTRAGQQADTDDSEAGADETAEAGDEDEDAEDLNDEMNADSDDEDEDEDDYEDEDEDDEEKADDDDEVEEKADDDEVEDEKDDTDGDTDDGYDPEDVNPAAETTGEDNPEVGGRSATVLETSVLLGRSLMGEKLTPAERAALKRAGYAEKL